MKSRNHFSEELQAFAAEYLRFDFEKGEIYWKKRRGGKAKAGSRTGYVETDERSGKKYRRMGLGGKEYREHRLLFCFHHRNRFEGFDIDHIDQNSLNNKIENLRAVTKSDNSRNAKQRKDNASGVTGVSWHKVREKWCAYIFLNGKHIHLGRFTKKRDAIFRRKLAESHYGYHPNHGRSKNQN